MALRTLHVRRQALQRTTFAKGTQPPVAQIGFDKGFDPVPAVLRLQGPDAALSSSMPATTSASNAASFDGSGCNFGGKLARAPGAVDTKAQISSSFDQPPWPPTQS